MRSIALETKMSASALSTAPSDPAGEALYEELEFLASNQTIDPKLEKLAQAILAQIGSARSFTAIEQAIDNVLLGNTAGSGAGNDAYMEFDLDQTDLNLFSLCLNISLRGLGPTYSLPANLSLTPADQLYQSLVNWIANAPSAIQKFGQDFLAQFLEQVHSSGSAADAATLFEQMIDTPQFFADYPGLSYNGAPNSILQQFAAQISGASFSNFTKGYVLYQINQWMATLTPGSAAYEMAQNFLNAVESMKHISPDESELKQWYSQTFSMANEDCFMQYPNVDIADIQQMYAIANGGAVNLEPTPADTTYRNVIAAQNTFAPGSANYNLLNALAQQLATIGSNPTNAQLEAVENWAKALQGPPANSLFASADPQVQQQVLAFSQPSFAETFMNDFVALNHWGAPPAPAYRQGFVGELGALLSQYYQQNQPNISAAGLQAFLNQALANTDFCEKYPGLDPSDVANAFSFFGVQSPYVYTEIDAAYAQCCQAAQNTTRQPDEGVLQSIEAAIKAAYATNDYAAILAQIGQLENSPEWGQLSSATQNTIWAIAETLNN